MRMLNSNDRERVVKAAQTSNLLVQDLRELVKTDNLLLSEFVALELLKQAVEVERKLKRIEALSRK